MKAAELRRKGKTFEEVRILGKFAKVLGMQLQMFLSGSSRCRRRPSLVRRRLPAQCGQIKVGQGGVWETREETKQKTVGVGGIIGQRYSGKASVPTGRS